MPERHTELHREKILLSSDDAAQAARLLRMLINGSDPICEMTRSVARFEQIDPDVLDYQADMLRVVAQQMYARRLGRSRYFPSDFFREPAWDMLLAFYAGSDSGMKQTVSGLLTFSPSPPTTALRYLIALEENGHVCRRACKKDGRVQYIELTTAGQAAMTRYLTAVVASEAR